MGVSTLSSIRPLNQEIKELPTGVSIEYQLLEVELECIQPCATNTRFALEDPISDDEHQDLINREDPARTENLTESLKRFPVTDVPMVYLPENSAKFEIIHGSRRYFSAKSAGLKTLLVWFMPNLSIESLEFIRDFPETHPTKVDHSSYAMNKMIFLHLKRARSSEERDSAIERIKIRYGMQKKKILKAERTLQLMNEICSEWSEQAEDRKQQYKAFESYDSLQENEFDRLRKLADFERLELLEEVAKSYLFNQIAHDDLKQSVSGLATLPQDDQIIQELADGTRDYKNADELRRLTQEIRLLAGRGLDPVEDVRRTLNRAYGNLIKNADGLVCESVLKEIQIGLRKFEALSASIN